ncbi:MAG TPA: hypothetical protein VK470_02625 [Bacteroidota bacterium]|nr:hypothetical protein [Bacteroidota bacterium]
MTPERAHLIKKIITLTAVTAFVLIASAVVFILVFSDPLLNRYAKSKIEHAFNEAYPGYALSIGSIHYNLFRNYSECRAILLSSSDSSLQCAAGSFSVSGIGWKQLIMERELTPETIRKSVLSAEDVTLRLKAGAGHDIHLGRLRVSVPDSQLTANDFLVEFEKAHYRLRCGVLMASARDSTLTAEGIELRTVAGDDDFFATSAYKKMRYNISIAMCLIRGIAVRELIDGRIFQANSLVLVRPDLDLLVNRDKPPDPNAPHPKMPAEALAAIGRRIALDTLRLQDGKLLYAERNKEQGKHAIVTFDSARLSVLGIRNASLLDSRMQGRARDTILLRGRARFMEQGTMSVLMHIPLSLKNYSVFYTGSLTSMDATALSRFVEVSDNVRITRGMLRDASFDVSVSGGRGSGKLRLVYDDLYLTMLDEETGSKNTLGKQLTTLFANIVKIHGSNVPNDRGELRIGSVDYVRDPTDSFMNTVWFPLRSAVRDVIGF